MSVPSITIDSAEHKLDIQTVSGYAFMQESLAYGFEPASIDSVEVNLIGNNNVPVSQVVEQPTLGGIVLQPDIDIQVGTATNSIVSQLLNSFRYIFPNFPSEEIEDGLTEGEICYFDDDVLLAGSQSTFSVYNCSLKHANVTQLSRGAKSNLFIYIGHTNGDLTLLHKGYYDMTSDLMPVWSPGKTIYLNNENKLNTSPTATSGHWVRSLGFCIPNTENKKRVWFEPDSTYLRII